MGPYTVMVDDNFDYMEEEERQALGSFATAEEAVAACKACVDASLTHLCKRGMSAAELLDQYRSFGDDPFVIAPPGAGRIDFSAWSYAEERIRKLYPRPGREAEQP
jgi:hypothetical protein